MKPLKRASASIRTIVEDTTTPAGRLFDAAIIATIVCLLVVVAWETVPQLPPRIRWWLELSEITITAVFVVEYALRILTARNKRAYLLSFYGIVDFVAIAPVVLFFLPIGTELLAVRAIRILRIFRSVKSTRYNSAIRRLLGALRRSRPEAELFLAVTGILLFIAAAGIYHFEHEAQPEAFSSIPASLWWAVATLTTVGYGDIYPITVGGKLFTFLILMCGMGIVAVPAGLIAAALGEMRGEERSRNNTDTDPGT